MSNFEPYKFFQMIDECKTRVENARNNRIKLFIKLRCYPGAILKVDIDDIKPICDIWTKWFFNGLIDFKVDAFLGGYDIPWPGVDNWYQVKKEFRKCMYAADCFGDIWSYSKHMSTWADPLRTRVVKDCELNETCVIWPRLQHYDKFSFECDGLMVDFSTQMPAHHPLIIRNAKLNPKFEKQMEQKVTDI